MVATTQNITAHYQCIDPTPFAILAFF